MNAREWIDAFAAEIGAEPPTDDEIKQMLDLAARRRALLGADRRADRLLDRRAHRRLARGAAGGRRPGRRRLGGERPSVRVAELWRYPVKGLRGERSSGSRSPPTAIPGDRGLRVMDERGIVTGRRKQRMIGVPATLGADGEPLIDGHPWDSPEAAAAIREVAGRRGAR